MYPNLLSIFDVHLQGVGFERILWILGLGFMIWGLVSSIMIWRKGQRTEGAIQGVIVTAIGAWFAVKLFQTFNSVQYVPVFDEEIIIHTYAFCILIGVILAFVVGLRIGQHEGLKKESIFNVGLGLVIFGFLGARLFFLLVEGHEYFAACFDPQSVGLTEPDCLGFVRMTDGGLVFYGGVISGFFVLLYNQHKNKVSILRQVDFLTPTLCISHGFGRLGCLAAGCCWGELTAGHLGVSYPQDSFAYHEMVKEMASSGNTLYADILAQGHTPLMHATQLMEAGCEFALFFFSLWYLYHRKFRGSVFAWWMILYGACRIFVEFMRGDVMRGYLFEVRIPWLNRLLLMPEDHLTMLSTSQVVGLCMIAFGIGLLLFVKKRNLLAEMPETAESHESSEAKQPNQESAKPEPTETKADVADEADDKTENAAEAENAAETEENAENAARDSVSATA